MLENIFLTLCRLPGFKKRLWRAWYDYLAHNQHARDWTFMNYGYAPLDAEPLSLEEADEPDRHWIGLYQHVAGAVDLRGRTALEVGSGRGGGASFVKRYLHPERMVGIDLSQKAVDLSRARHAVPGLEFQVGDAEHLPCPAASMDVVLNVESSHCYPSLETFLGEVRRVLRPGGHFLYADLRRRSGMDAWRNKLLASGLSVLRETDITPNVVAALEFDDARKIALIDRLIPKPLRSAFQNFAAVKGSSTFESFRSGALTYRSFVLERPHEL